MVPMTSVYTLRYAQELHECGFEWIKIGSAQCTDYDLVKSYIALGYNVVQSVGGHDVTKMERFSGLSGVLHCNSQYPTHPMETNMTRMIGIKYLWRNTPYGFSSHVDPSHPEWLRPLSFASYLGATFLEVHYSVLAPEETKDGKVSLGTEQLSVLCEFDALTTDQKCTRFPWLGMYKFIQPQTEFALIEKYKGRWED